MGLDAFVMSKSFEEGKLAPGPISASDPFVDEGGYLSSRKIEAAYRKYDIRRFDARYGQLEKDFREWLDNCCIHGDGEACSEWVSSWAGCAMFNEVVNRLGGVERFPLLSALLPKVNEGIWPAGEAARTLEELDRLIEALIEAEGKMPEGTGLSWNGEALLFEEKYVEGVEDADVGVEGSSVRPADGEVVDLVVVLALWESVKQRSFYARDGVSSIAAKYAA